jgi:hypothetical protein
MPTLEKGEPMLYVVVFDFVCALLATFPTTYGAVTGSSVEFYRPSSEGSPALTAEADDQTPASVA